MPTVGLTILKRFPYRGAVEEYSNQYWLTGSEPADPTAWRALFDAMVAQEKKVYPPTTEVVGGYGYYSSDEDDHSVWSVDLTVSPDTPVVGTCSQAAGTQIPGDTAAWVRWKTSRLNTKGKAIYLRKYFHDVLMNSSARDEVQASFKTAALAFAVKLYDGSLVDGRKIRSLHNDETIIAHGVSQYTTTRTLKRRGKRPGS